MSNFNILSSVVRSKLVARFLRTTWSVLPACWLALAPFLIADLELYVASPTSGTSWSGWARKRRRRDPLAASANYGRYSSELQDEASIESQRDLCRQAAGRDGQPIDPRFEYADSAVSGTKLHREGLDTLLADAEAGRFNQLYFFSLSRLARESIIGMPILKRLVNVLKIRVVSVTEGLDTAREGWEQIAQILLMQHERYIKELSANTLRGQKSNLKNRFSNGDYCFGYTSVPVAGSEATRRGRHARPRMTYAIHPINSGWVRRIFHWFVRERRSIRWITRELNRLGAPKDHRSKKSKKWHHQYVTRLLANRKYIGDWAWGEMQNVRDPATGLLHQEPREAAEAEQYRRTFADLRLIDDATFGEAQRILGENRETYAHGRDEEGEFVAGREGASPPASHLLSGLIVCDQPVEEAVCGRTFYVGGSRGKYLFCPAHHDGSCSCRTQLPRRLAEDLILGEIGARILANPAWLEVVYEATRAAWNDRRQTLPNELRDTLAALEEVNRKIERLLDSLEDEGKPDPDVTERLVRRRAERRQLETRLAAARRAAAEQPVEPTFEWVRDQVRQLGTVLASATPAAAYALRDLLDGPIRVRQIDRPGKKRHFLRGVMRIRSATVFTALGMKPSHDTTSESLSEEITIDFVRANPSDARSEVAKAFWDQCLPNKEIAQRLGCKRSMVTKLLKHWSRLHGVALPDGRTRRGQLPSSPDALPLYQRIAEPVMELYRKDMELGEIARELRHDRNTVTAAVRYWHVSRGLPVPDGRTRRKSLPRSSESAKNENVGDRKENPPAVYRPLAPPLTEARTGRGPVRAVFMRRAAELRSSAARRRNLPVVAANDLRPPTSQ